MAEKVHSGSASEQISKLIDSVCTAFRSAIEHNPEVEIEAFLDTVPDSSRSTLLLKLISVDLQSRRAKGKQPSLDFYLSRFPEDRDLIQQQFFGSLSSDIPLDETIDTSKLPLDSQAGETSTKRQWDVGDSIDRYEIRAIIGQGGFGQVFRALDPVLDREVAIKLHTRRSRDDDYPGEMLLQEGKRLAKLNHQGVVRVLDAGIFKGEFYLVSEYMPGGTLGEQLNDGFMTPDIAVRYTMALADALQHAHSRGFVHRDIKPANILFDENGQPRLADFGLAASEEELAKEFSMTVGTAAYMSPEQARGTSNLVDPRSDIYSLGLVLYRMLTGRLPFKGDSVREMCEQIAHREPRPLRLIDSSIPAELEAICLKCLNTTISRRYTTASDLKQALEQWRQSTIEEPASAVSTTQAAPATSPFWWSATVVVIGILAITGIGYVIVSSAISRSAADSAPPPAADLKTDEPTPLAKPEVVVWQPFDAHDKHGYDEERQLYYMDAFGPSLFQIDEQPQGPLHLNCTFSVSRWKGLAGVFWSRNPHVKYDSSCRAIKVGRYREDLPFVVEICQLSVGAYSGAQMAVVSEATLLTLKPELPPADRAFLEVQIDGVNLTSLRLNGQELLQQTFRFVELEGELEGPRGFGFLGQMGKIQVHKFIGQ